MHKDTFSSCGASISVKVNKTSQSKSSIKTNTQAALITLTTQSHENERKPLNIIFVIDISGSMHGEKIELVKNSLEKILCLMSGKDRASIILFNDKPIELFSLEPLTSENINRIVKEMKRVVANYGTDIASAMKMAFSTIKSIQNNDSINSVFLLSDGLDENAGIRIQEQLIKAEISQHFTIHTFGYGQDHDPKLMTQISDLKDGEFYFIDRLHMIDIYFAECLGGVMSAVFKNIEITVNPAEKVKIAKVYGGNSLWKKNENGSFSANYLQIAAEASKNLLVDFKLVDEYDENLILDSSEVILGEVETKMFDLEGHLVRLETQFIKIKVISDDSLEKDDIDVFKHQMRYKSAEALHQATKNAEGSKFEEAQKGLHEFQAELKSCQYKEDPFVMNLLEDIMNGIKSVDKSEWNKSGQASITANSRSYEQEKSSTMSANKRLNSQQMDLITKVSENKSYV